MGKAWWLLYCAGIVAISGATVKSPVDSKDTPLLAINTWPWTNATAAVLLCCHFVVLYFIVPLAHLDCRALT